MPSRSLFEHCSIATARARIGHPRFRAAPEVRSTTTCRRAGKTDEIESGRPPAHSKHAYATSAPNASGRKPPCANARTLPAAPALAVCSPACGAVEGHANFRGSQPLPKNIDVPCVLDSWHMVGGRYRPFVLGPHLSLDRRCAHMFNICRAPTHPESNMSTQKAQETCMALARCRLSSHRPRSHSLGIRSEPSAVPRPRS